jgi:transposase
VLLATHQELGRPKAELEARTAELTRQLDWCKRHLFGRKSARRLRALAPHQLSLSGRLTTPLPATDQPPPPSATLKASQRRVRLTGADLPEERELRVAPSVPVEVLAVPNPAVADRPPEAYDVIGEKSTSR